MIIREQWSRVNGLNLLERILFSLYFSMLFSPHCNASATDIASAHVHLNVGLIQSIHRLLKLYKEKLRDQH